MSKIQDHASREWAINPKSDAWWRAAAAAKRVEFNLDLPRVGISTAHVKEPVMFQREYDWNRHD